jgi:hypothetical protein
MKLLFAADLVCQARSILRHPYPSMIDHIREVPTGQPDTPHAVPFLIGLDGSQQAPGLQAQSVAIPFEIVSAENHSTMPFKRPKKGRREPVGAKRERPVTPARTSGVE